MKFIFSSMIVILSFSVNADEKTANVMLNEENVESHWVLEKRMRPLYPRKANSRGEVGCVNTAYLIDADGKTYSHKVLLTIPEGHKGFQNASLKAIKKAKYKPSVSNSGKKPVITSKSLTFVIQGWHMKGMDEVESEAKLREMCKIDLTKLSKIVPAKKTASTGRTNARLL